MSSRCKVIFERGRFFIESGTSKSFLLFCRNSSGIVKYIPQFIIKRITDFINRGDKDSAITLWMKACESADHTNIKIIGFLVYYFIQLLIISILIYTFIKVILL